MRLKTVDQQNMCYLSDKLKQQLSQIPYYPLTIVEAPSGFGKTTAVRKFLKENLPDNAQQYWYTCLGEPSCIAWNGICDLLSNVNAELALSLKNLRLPTMDTLMYIPAMFRDHACTVETYLAIDNYQMLHCDIPRELMNVFAIHGSPKLHFIFITQNLERSSQLAFHHPYVYAVDPAAFFFDPESTARLSRMEGIRLSQSELNDIYANTEGWAAAIRLQIIHYKEHGSFGYTIGMEQLVETAIWNRLAPEEKDFLISVSVMDSFSASQAAIILGEETLPENIEKMLKYNNFIRYFPDKGIYVVHSILQEYLRKRFYHYKSESFQKRALRLAGQSYVAVSQYFAAAQFFLKIQDFDAILSMPVDDKYIGDQKEKSILEFIRNLVDNCPEDTLVKYPFTLLTFSTHMYAEGYFDTYRKLQRLIESVLKTNENLSPAQLWRIKSESSLMAYIEAYNDVSKMREKRQKIWDLSEKTSERIKCAIPFTFGCPSVLFLFWRESGQLENALRGIAEGLPIYRKYTQGHGTGADCVMQAEALLMRGEDVEAEVLCYKALYQARSCQCKQVSICLSAELVLVRIAILRGDVEGYFAGIRNIKEYVKENSSLYVFRMVDLCLTSINLFVGNIKGAASWVHDMESISKTMYSMAVPYAQVFCAILLFHQKRYGEFRALVSVILDEQTKAGSDIRYMMPLVYCFKYLAIASLKKGKLREAQSYFQKALAISLPDRVYLPLAQHSNTYYSLIESAKGAVTDKEGWDALIALCKRQETGVAAIRRALIKEQSLLTPREKEIALLVKERLSAQEIAEKLYISKATVKTTIRNVYSKLGIHSRYELDSLEMTEEKYL